MKLQTLLIFMMMLTTGLAGCLEVDSDTETDSDPNEDDNEDVGPIAIYGFEIDDSSEPVSSDNKDQLVFVTYKQGNEIEIPSQIQVELTVDGYSMEVCEYSSEGDGSDVDGPMCYYSISDNSEPVLWSVGEVLTIGEVEMSYCESSCNLQVEIRDGESESLMGESLSGTAE